MCIVSQDSYTNPCLVIAPLALIGELHATSSHDHLDRLGPVMAVSGQGHLRSRVGSMVRRRSVHHDRSPGSLFLTIAQCTTLPGEARYSSVHGLTQSQRSAADLRRFLKGEPTRSGFPQGDHPRDGPFVGWLGRIDMYLAPRPNSLVCQVPDPRASASPVSSAICRFRGFPPMPVVADAEDDDDDSGRDARCIAL